MGYFVQITGEVGSPIFQAVNNYPDVSFASGALFHALVTASIENGHVPSIVRSQDCIIALAAHGAAGSRLSFALVTSEFPSGQTELLEDQLQWRLHLILRGALLVAGGDLLKRQPMQQLTKLLAQRLAPMVTQIMAGEGLPEIVRPPPRFGLSTLGVASEWLPASAAADAAFERLVASLPAGGGVVLAGLSPHATDQTLAVLSWRGRALSSTPAWRRLDSVDRALLLLLADEVGPPSFEQATHSWTLEAQVERLWLPSSAAAFETLPSASTATATATPTATASPSTAAGGAATGGTGMAAASTHGASMTRTGSETRSGPTEVDALAFLGASQRHLPLFGQGLRRKATRHRMVNIRIFPESCKDGMDGKDCKKAPPPVSKTASGDSGAHSGRLPKEMLHGEREDVVAAWNAEASLVFTVLAPEHGEPEAAGPRRPHVTPAALVQSTRLCGRALQELWDSQTSASSKTGPKRSPIKLQNRPPEAQVDVLAAILINEANQDAVVAPSACMVSDELPWKCSRRAEMGESLRRLLYWMHSLPPVSDQRPQQYICCEEYSIGAVRREDGIQCWAVLQLDAEATAKAIQAKASAAASAARGGGGDASDSSLRDGFRSESPIPQSPLQGSAILEAPILSAVMEILARVPSSGDIRHGFSNWM